MAIDISVVIPVLNERPRLRACLSALGQQTFDRTRYEIIAVDNGSTDGSKQFLAQNADVVIDYPSRRDPYLARNAGVAVAQGRLIAFTDAHCVVVSDWLQQIWQALGEGEAQALVGPLRHAADASYPLCLYDAYHQSKMAYIFERNMTQHLFCHAGNLALVKTLFDELGGFPALPLPGDTQMIQRLANRSPPTSIRFDDQAVVRRQSTRTLRAMLRKTATHARYNAVLGAVAGFSTLPWAHRRGVLRACRRDHRLSGADTLILVSVLIAGVLVYEVARWRARRLAG